MKTFSMLMALAALCLASCQNTTQESGALRTEQSEAALPTENDSIVKTSITDEHGNTLDMAFDNASETATFVFGQDTILLTQDVMASGIQYSNDQYIFVEHQGNATLSKDGEVVFEKKN